MIFNKIFSSHTVFAAEKPIRLYGEGEGSATLVFAGITKEVTSKNGEWYVEFPPMEYGGPYTLKLIENGNETLLEDIFVGEVYLLAGQSNIELRLDETNTPKERYLSNEKLRYFAVDKITTNIGFCPDDGWCMAEEKSVKYWSAIGYLTGFEIAEEKNIAVGLINCNQGASVIESWVPAGTFEKLGINIPLDKKSIGHSYPDYKRWNTDGALYEHQLRQVFPFSISGVIWYQGEADAYGEEANVYDVELCELIRLWRESFRDETLPFYVIQIADYRPENDYARDYEGWARVQDAQLKIQEMTDNVKSVICRDICEKDNIHPPTKDKLSARLAETIMEKK